MHETMRTRRKSDVQDISHAFVEWGWVEIGFDYNPSKWPQLPYRERCRAIVKKSVAFKKKKLRLVSELASKS